MSEFPPLAERVPSCFILWNEGFEPYIEYVTKEYDSENPENNDFYGHHCQIKPSASPEIRAKIEKRLKELEKGRRVEWGGDFPPLY